jgi:photosystem II stability/assembly factor-like uncharacterized protein
MKRSVFRSLLIITFFANVLLASSVCSAAEPKTLEEKLLETVPARLIGPANMSGRISAVAVHPQKPSTLYVGAASGGVWKTVNNGASWKPLFDDQPVSSIGDVALAPSNPDIVWVGTGEANARNSVSWGNGVYKSIDGGKTWTNMGLRDSRHIGRIVIHPTNPDVVFVAALGHIWGPNRDRGVFKTQDGGLTWECVLFLDESTGCIDLAMNPQEPDMLYTSAFQVRRDHFAGGNPAVQFGPKAGLYKTIDGGKTWERLTKGLPESAIGRCGLSICAKNPKVLLAIVPTDKTSLEREKEFGQPAKSAGSIETGGVFRTEDAGASWKKMNDLCPRSFYFGQIRVDPGDENRVYVLGVTLHVSTDGGQTFKSQKEIGVHDDFHALWIDPQDSDHMVIGTDGGLYLTYDRGKVWEAIKNLPLGQFYGIAVDMRRPYRVYGGLQDNGTWGGPSATHNAEGITAADWVKIMSADGFHCQVDPSDQDTVYALAQYGALRRINVHLGTSVDIRPRSATGASEFRFNWSSPILVSPHSPHSLYFGGNHVFRSSDRGDHWEVLSKDLTKGAPGPNAEMGHTITALAESPLTAGLLFAGTDDGQVFIYRQESGEWIDIGKNLIGVPLDRWITAIECSRFAEGTVYLTVDRHREDDCKAYIYKTVDYGATWQSIASNLPANGPVKVIREDPRQKQLLYAGTEFGAFVILNQGAGWRRLAAGLPTVAVDDLVIHSRDRELVVGTHGRSLYVLDIAPLQEWCARTLEQSLVLFDVKPAMLFDTRGSHALSGTKTLVAQNPAFGATIRYFLSDKSRSPVRLIIADSLGNKVASLDAGNEPGFHQLIWDLKPSKDSKIGKDRTKIVPGEYSVRLEAGPLSAVKKLRVELEE